MSLPTLKFLRALAVVLFAMVVFWVSSAHHKDGPIWTLVVVPPWAMYWILTLYIGKRSGERPKDGY